MIEEALGLRVYQLKKNETLRKLEHTDANISQGEALVREIAPHLKFLKIQAEKAERREEVATELREFQKIYFVRESSELERERAAVEKESAPLKARLGDVRDAIGALEGEIGIQEQKLKDAMSSSENRELHDLEKRRRERERERRRLAGETRPSDRTRRRPSSPGAAAAPRRRRSPRPRPARKAPRRTATARPCRARSPVPRSPQAPAGKRSNHRWRPTSRGSSSRGSVGSSPGSTRRCGAQDRSRGCRAARHGCAGPR